MSYSDPIEVIAYERAMRVHRAHTELHRVELLDGDVDPSFRVVSESERPYHVDLVADEYDLHDTCDCPDWLANELGTCKHLEAVRRVLIAKAAWRRALAPSMARRRAPTIGVDPQSGALLAIGSMGERALEACGLRAVGRGAALEVIAPERLRAGRTGGVRVVHAAVPAAARAVLRTMLSRRRAHVSRALANGKLGVDVLSTPLFPYQRAGVAHLVAAGRALLADDMGLGKTIQAIAACEVLRARGEATRILVVTPASLKHQWAQEIERGTGERAVIVRGGATERSAALASDAPYKILNYELTWRELMALRALDADVLVLDEAQRAKNFRTKTATTLRAIPSRYLFVLTGTPVENRLDDLYSLLQLTDPAILGPLWRFNHEFHTQNTKGKVVGYCNLSALRARIAPVVLRRRKEEVLTQLPALTEQTRYVPMSPKQVELEESYRADAARFARIAERRALTLRESQAMLACLLKARQACNAAVLCDPTWKDRSSSKLDELEAIVGEVIAQGTSRILVFSEWTTMLELAAERLEAMGVGFEMLHGGVPTDKRPGLLQRFREEPDRRVLLSTDAGGVGLNLQIATYVIHLDLPWNPGKLDQRTARAHRLGQTHGVSVTYLCAERGIERGIEGTLAGKRVVRSAALDISSDIEEAEAPSAALFLRQMRMVLDAQAIQPVEVVEVPTPAIAQESSADQEEAKDIAVAVARTVAEAAAVPALEPTPTIQAPTAIAPLGSIEDRPQLGSTTPPAVRSPYVERADGRLRLARLVLEAGFHGDAVRAGYDALSSAIRALFEESPALDHTALVAAIFRELLPAGRLPHAAHGVLARLHDLTHLEAAGVVLDRDTARTAVDEAASWVERLSFDCATLPV